MRIVFLLCCGLFACQDAPSSDHSAALSHAAPAETRPLSAAELDRLARAEGRTVTPVSAAALDAAIAAREEPTLVVQFWQLDCADCLRQNTALEATGVPTIYVNLDAAGRRDAVNAHIRAAGLTGTIFQLDPPDAALRLTNGPVPALPYFRVIDRANGVGIDYRQYLPTGALQAVLGTVTGGDS